MRLDEHFLVSPTIIKSRSSEASEALKVSKIPSKETLPDGVLCRVSYPICNIGEKNANNRVYEKAVWDKVLIQDDLKRKLKNRSLFGHAEHPEQTQSNLEKTCHVIFEMWQDNGVVWQTLDILDTPTGRIVDCCLRAGCKVGMSTRAEGDLEEAEDDNGAYQKVVVESYSYETTDFTADPSVASALPHNVKFKVVSEIKKVSEMDNITNSEKEFAYRILESIKCENKGGHCEVYGMDKKKKYQVNDIMRITKEALQNQKVSIQERNKDVWISSLQFDDVNTIEAKVVKIDEKSISLNVVDTDGTDVAVIVDGETNVNIDQTGIITVVPGQVEVPEPIEPVEELPDSDNTGLGMSAIDNEPAPDMVPEAKGIPATDSPHIEDDYWYDKKGNKAKVLDAHGMDIVVKLETGSRVVMKEKDFLDKYSRNEAKIKVPESISDEEVSSERGDEIKKEFSNLLSKNMSSSDALAKVAKDNNVSWSVVEELVGLSEAKKKKPAVGDKIKMLEDGEHKDKEGIITSIDENTIGISLDGGVDVLIEDPSTISITTVQPPTEPDTTDIDVPIEAPADESPCPDEEAPDRMEDLAPDDDMDEKIPAEDGISDKLQSGNLLQDKDGTAWIVQSADDGALTVTQPGEPGSEKRIPWDEADSYGFVKLSESKINEAASVVYQDDGWYVISSDGKVLGGPYNNRAKANQRLRDIGFWKSNESVDEGRGEEVYQEALVFVKGEIEKQMSVDHSFNELSIRDSLTDKFGVTTDEAEEIVIRAAGPEELDLGDIPNFESASESINIVKDLRVKEAATRAERDKAIELLEEFEDKSQVNKGKVFEVKILVKKINETLRIKEIEEAIILSKLEEKAKFVSDLTKQVNEQKDIVNKTKKEMTESVLNSVTHASNLRKSVSVTEKKQVKVLKTLKGKHAQDLLEAEKKYHEEVSKAVSEAEEAVKNIVTKEFVKRFVDIRLSESNLTIDDNSRALLEGCKSFDEAEELLEDVVDASRRNALHSKSVRSIKVVQHKVINEETTEAERSVGIAFEGMGT